MIVAVASHLVPSIYYFANKRWIPLSDPSQNEKGGAASVFLKDPQRSFGIGPHSGREV